MNIEEAIEMLKRIYVTEFNTSSIYDNVPNVNLAIETLLTAYEKEKVSRKVMQDNWSQNVKLVEELKAELEKEKEKSEFLDNELYNTNQEIQELQLNIAKEKEKNKNILSDNIESFQKYFSEELYTKFMDKEKLRKIIYPTPENPIPIEIQQSEMYKKLLKEMEE